LSAAVYPKADNLVTRVDDLRNQRVDGGVGLQKAVEIDHHAVPQEERAGYTGFVGRQTHHLAFLIRAQRDARIVTVYGAQVFHARLPGP
jgi:hypothetical protein